MKSTKQHRKSILLLYILFGYIIAQISWWIFQIILLSKQLDNTGGMAQMKVRMLTGEFAVFFFIFCAGIIYIRKVFKRELELSQSKKNFSLSITHELKTPITTTKLFIETLQNHNLSEEKRNEVYQKVQLEQDRLQTLIEKVLLSERVGSAEFKVNLKKTNINAFAEEELSKMNFKQEIQLHIDGNIDVLIDDFYFRSVFSNLIENASKYSDVDAFIQINISKKNDACLIEIIDQGVGIPDDEKLKIFDVYYRLENEEIRNTAGTGLGLYLVKKIVTLHNGNIRVKNNPSGKGSVFEVLVPLAK